MRTARRETVFRAQLVLRINTVTHEMVERQAFVHRVLAQQFAIAGGLGQAADRSGAAEGEINLTRCRRLIGQRCTELQAAEMARTQVEARHLEGQLALFPAGLRRWLEQRRLADELAAMAARLAELDGADPLEPPAEPTAARVAELMAELVQPARVSTLEWLGEGARAQALAIQWLRPKLIPAGPE